MCLRRLLWVVFSLLTLAAMAAAQTQTCRLEGVVLDPAGAVVPKAKVTATNLKTQLVLEATSNSEGLYVLAALQPGLYNMTVEAPGFRKYAINNIQLDAGATVSQNIHLEMGQTTEVVEVQANTVTVQTSESQVSRATTMRDIDTLPVLNRTPIQLVNFAPGTSINPGDTTYTRINGLRQGSNNATLDGIDVNDAVVPRLGLSMTANNTDSVSEVRLITAGGKAEYGRNAGGQVEMITRSGTNQYHGNLFEYLRNTDLNANDFFSNSAGVARPMFIQNIFGGSFGGPIKHDKLFIFGNYQGRRTHQQISRVRTVPTASARQGIYTWSGGTYNIAANDPLHLGIDPAVQKLLSMFPAPNDHSVGDGYNTAGFRFNQPNNSLEDQFTVKGDYNMNSTNHFFYRHSWQRNSAIDSLNSADAPFPGGAQGTQGGHRWGIAAGWDWTISNDLINEFRYGHQSAAVAFLRPERVQGLMYSFSSFTNPLYTGAEQGRNSPVNEFTENMTWIHGTHTFKGGVNIRRVLQYGWNYGGVWPTATFSTAYAPVPASATPPGVTGADLTRFQSLYDDLLGRISTITQTFFTNLQTYQPAGQPSVRNYLFTDAGSFFQDDWKIRANLTLNIGLRWEVFGTPTEENGLQGTLSNIATLSPTNPANNLSVKPMKSWYKTDWNNLAPRFGFSWDPTGTGRMAIRGAYGIFYDRIIGATTSLVDSNSPGFAEGQTTYPNAGGADVRASQTNPMPAHGAAPLTTPLDNRSTSIVLFNPNLATGYVHQYSLTIQREFLHNTIVEGGYVGNRGVKLFMDRDINQPMVYNDFLGAFKELQAFQANGTAPSANNTLVRIFGTPQAAITALGATNVSQGLLGTAANTLDRTYYTKYAAAGVSDFYLRPFPQFNQVIWGSNDGRSYYDSLQLSLRRNTGALKFSVNYTFSKSIDNGSVDGNGFTNVPDNNNLTLNRARGDYDRPHVLNYQALYTIPLGRGLRFGSAMPHWADTLIGGWSLGILGIWESGSVFSVSSGRVTGPGTFTSYADYSGDRNIGGIIRTGNGIFYFDPSVYSQFSYPVAGTTGTSGRNAFRGPRYYNNDASLVKSFRITERKSASFRAEAYNLWNNENFSNPSVTLTNGAAKFGQISTTAGSARVMQMTLRFDF